MNGNQRREEKKKRERNFLTIMNRRAVSKNPFKDLREERKKIPFLLPISVYTWHTRVSHEGKSIPLSEGG